MATKKVEKKTTITIQPLNMQTAHFRIIGTAPYVQEKFSEKAKTQMREKMLAGSTAKKNTKREARDFDSDYEGSFHRTKDGWVGLPANGIRQAMIDACRTAGFTMTRAKMSVFVLADGYDEEDRTPLVRLEGEPRRFEMAVRNSTGVPDLRHRPIWDEWEALVRLQFDGDQFTAEDVTNLLVRTGVQVGLGAGRPYSKKSAGMGWGTFRIAETDEDGGNGSG